MMAGEELRSLVAEQVFGTCDFPDEQRDQLLGQIKQRYGQGLLAVLIYGSYLRGKRDTLLDFYVLLDSYASMPKAWQGWLAKALPPNVYQIHHGQPPDEIRAKYALLTLGRFENAVRRDFHSYFWARFAQPCGILYCRDEEVRERVIAAICQSCETFARRVAPRLPQNFDAKQMWAKGLGLTYQCEFRSEPPGHAEKLFGYWPDYYRAVTQTLAGQGLGFELAQNADTFSSTSSDSARRWSPASAHTQGGAYFRWRPGLPSVENPAPFRGLHRADRLTEKISGVFRLATAPAPVAKGSIPVSAGPEFQTDWWTTRSEPC